MAWVVCAVVRFRSGCSGRPIDAGQWACPKVLGSQHVCHLCQTGEVCDEILCVTVACWRPSESSNRLFKIHTDDPVHVAEQQWWGCFVCVRVFGWLLPKQDLLFMVASYTDFPHLGLLSGRVDRNLISLVRLERCTFALPSVAGMLSEGSV